MDCLLVIDKSAGPTSHDVVARTRRLLGEKRIGHTGTLDPLATGVLPLVIGKATRLASLISAGEKEYDAGIRLGASTATYDAAGIGAPPPAPAIGLEAIDAALERFRGAFDQMPPPYSAKKVAGVPAYKLARRQQPAALRAVPVTVHQLERLGLVEGLLRVRVSASAGFYVRSLAHDLGAHLGCGAYLESLRRTRAGRFGLDRAVRLDDLERDPSLAANARVPIDDLVPELPGVRVTESEALRISHGNSLRMSELVETGPSDPFRVRVVDVTGRLLAIAVLSPEGVLRPSIVLV